MGQEEDGHTAEKGMPKGGFALWMRGKAGRELSST